MQAQAPPISLEIFRINAQPINCPATATRLLLMQRRGQVEIVWRPEASARVTKSGEQLTKRALIPRPNSVSGSVAVPALALTSAAAGLSSQFDVRWENSLFLILFSTKFNLTQLPLYQQGQAGNLPKNNNFKHKHQCFCQLEIVARPNRRA